MAVILAVAHDAIVGNVAEQNVAPSREVDRSLGPAEACRDALNRAGAGEGWEAARSERDLGMGRLQMGIRIAAVGQRPQGEPWGWPKRSGRFAKRGYSFSSSGRLQRRAGCHRCRRALEQGAACEAAGLILVVGKRQWTCHDFLPYFCWKESIRPHSGIMRAA